MKRFPNMVLVPIFFWFPAFAPGAAHADTFVVPDDYPSISGAANVAESGDSIMVHPGLYEEEVVLNPGVTLMSFEGFETTWIAAPSAFKGAIKLLGPGTETTRVIGFYLFQNNDYGVPVVFSYNPQGEITDCLVAYGGPGDELYYPCILLWSGGIVRRCLIYHDASSHAIWSRAAGAETLIEDSVLHTLVYLLGMDGFGSGSTTTFKNNTFLGSYVRGNVSEGAPSDFAVVFVNNIFFDDEGIRCNSHDPMPDGLEYRYNCFWPRGEPDNCPNGPGNFTADPLLCDEQNDDVRLDPESPCFGAGENGEDVGARWGICGVTAVGESSLEGASGFRLWPNPASRSVSLVLDAIPRSPATVRVVDPAGRLIRTIPFHRDQRAATWDGRTHSGGLAPTGTYFISMEIGGIRTTRRVTLIR